MQETWVWFLGQEAPVEKGMATHSSILTWRIPWIDGPWWAIIHGVTKSQTQLSNLTFSKNQHLVSLIFIFCWFLLFAVVFFFCLFWVWLILFLVSYEKAEVIDLRPSSLTQVFSAINVPFSITYFDMLCFIFVHFKIFHDLFYFFLWPIKYIL